MTDRLQDFPRVSLAHLPTPLEPLARLSDSLGAEVWVKRDDATGLALGGNKVRKLEFLLGEALADGVTTVVTVGGVQSNHARQTAAAAARLGLRCRLVLPRVVPRAGVEYEGGGNVLLDRILGADVRLVEDEAAAGREIARIVDEAERAGEKVVVHPPGGSTPVGCLGYANAALEVDAQASAQGLTFERVYLAAGTGGTLAGIVCGAAMASWSSQLHAVCVARDEKSCEEAVVPLVGECAKLLGIPSPSLDLVRYRGEFLGDGYGIPTPQAREAIELAARTEGLILDPVYTAKAMAAVIADARAGTLGGPVVFWHTGGAPGLFAYRDAFDA